MLASARARGSWLRVVVLSITAFVPIVLFVTPIYTFYTLLASQIWEAISPIPLVVVTFVLLALMLGVLVPHLYFLGGGRR